MWKTEKGKRKWVIEKWKEDRNENEKKGKREQKGKGKRERKIVSTGVKFAFHYLNTLKCNKHLIYLFLICSFEINLLNLNAFRLKHNMPNQND